MSRLISLASLALATVVLIAGSPIGAAEVQYLPDDTDFVIGINLRQIRQSPLVVGDQGAMNQLRDMLKSVAAEVEILNCLQDAGVDLFRDLSRISIAGSRKSDLKIAFLMLEGDFPNLKLIAKLKQFTAKSSTRLKINADNGITSYEMYGPSDQREYAAFADENRFIVTRSKNEIIDVLARHSGKTKSTIPKAFQTMLGAGQDSESIRVAATGPTLSQLLAGFKVPNGETAVAAFKTLEAASASITIDTTVRFEFSAFVRDDPTAKQISDASGNAIITLQRLAQQKADRDKNFEPVAGIAKTLAIRSLGPLIMIRGEASLDAIEKLMKNPPNAGIIEGRR